MSNPAVLTINNLTVAYDRHPAVHHISGSFAKGSLTAVAGPNGAGKSTLLKAIIGDIRASQGSVDHALKRAEFGYLPQATDINRRFPISVLETVLLGTWKTAGAFGSVTQKDEKRAEEALATVGLSGFEKRSIGALSAGQFQRVLFARLLMQDASVILLDEPFTAIDARTTRDLLDIVTHWHGEGRTVIAVLHDFEQVRTHFPETLLIARELIAWGPTHQVMSPVNLLRARIMAERWDDASDVCEPAA
ncbi:metal ABC transporter ATP-binding protein [Agrobacterium rosae]|uniref:ABC transporter n=1 Tax=Agrobacterium rosae TaxID=1972867 RepID=A0AAE5VPK5_9HYPH|nr:ABC transporter ATP-binding protein [Agrobacterium rosae]KAA3514241.1 ABC transporter ATP-binding protein [Agrobacterium rosae]KAA3522907.1 ABC transporter ATP-binding protein [Agrobacterium rosae]MCM2433803.1 ABC transporter ATP-binding protein [Agrobacterium rosae]MDX8330642.1 ABC transporter ATP-binding protein [Agrobacterium rosae]MQB47603.1 ABC transporter ATP-binding protein [Agrobacterium rosae]